MTGFRYLDTWNNNTGNWSNRVWVEVSQAKVHYPIPKAYDQAGTGTAPTSGPRVVAGHGWCRYSDIHLWGYHEKSSLDLEAKETWRRRCAISIRCTFLQASCSSQLFLSGFQVLSQAPGQIPFNSMLKLMKTVGFLFDLQQQGVWGRWRR